MLFSIKSTVFEGNEKRRKFHNELNNHSKKRAFENAIERKKQLDKVTEELDKLYKTSEDARRTMQLIAERNTLLTMYRSAEEIYENGILGDFKPNKFLDDLGSFWD